MLDLSWEGVQVNRVTVGKLSQVSQFDSSYIRVFHWSKFWSSITEQKWIDCWKYRKLLDFLRKITKFVHLALIQRLGIEQGFLFSFRLNFMGFLMAI